MRCCLIGTFGISGLVLLAACGDALSPETLAGSYVATTFTLSGEVAGDVLAEGGHMNITFNADGTTTGSLFVPESLNDEEGDFNADMAGTFVITDQTVALTQGADTFVRDVTWTVDGSQVHGSGTFSGVTITVILTRQ